MPESQRSKDVSVLGRVFKLRLLSLMNGCFLVVSEGVEERVGAVIVSLKLERGVKSTTIIPPRYGKVFSTILAEMVANLSQGMTILSLYLTCELDTETGRGLLREVKDFLKEG